MSQPTSNDRQPPAAPAGFRSQMASELRQAPRRLWDDFLAGLLELAANVVVAAVVIGFFALVGSAIGGSTGALLGGLVGIGVFAILRALAYVGVAVWGFGWVVKEARRSR